MTTQIPEPRPPTSIILLSLLAACLLIYAGAYRDLGLLVYACVAFVLEACHFAHASWRILARREARELAEREEPNP
jgi:hypothetical protein